MAAPLIDRDPANRPGAVARVWPASLCLAALALVLWLLAFPGTGRADDRQGHWLTTGMAAVLATQSAEELRVAVHEFPTSFWDHADPQTAVPVLKAFVLNPADGWEIRRFATLALSKVGDRGHAGEIVPILAAALDFSLRDWSVRQEAAVALGSLGAANLEATLPALGTALADGDDRVRAAAMAALQRLGAVSPARVIPFLVALLADNEDLRAIAAAKVLGDLGAAAAIRPLAFALSYDEDRSAPVRQAALRALGRIGRTHSAETRPILLAILNDAAGPPEMRQSALLALAEASAHADRETRAAIARTLQDPAADPALREAAAQALGMLGPSISEAEVQTLVDVLTTGPDIYLKASAARALGAIGTRSAEAVPALLAAMRGEAAQGRAVVLRLAAAEALGMILRNPQDRTLRAFAEAFSDPNQEIRRTAGSALARIGDHAPAAVYDLLIAILDSPETARQRSAAAHTLGRMNARPPTAALAALAAALQDTLGFDVRRNAATALGRIGHHDPQISIPALMAALRHPDLSIRRAAVTALAGFGTATPQDAIPDLIRALQEARTGPAGNASAAGTVPLSADTLVQQAAARALGRVSGPSPEVIAALINAVQSGRTMEIRREAAQALGQTGAAAPELAIPGLLSVVGDFSAPWLVREAGGRALDTLLHTQPPVSTQSLLGVLDRAHDGVEGRLRYRVWSRLLSAHSTGQRNLVALLGRPGNRFAGQPDPSPGALRGQLDLLEQELAALAAYPRLHREAGESVIDIVGHPNWPPGQRTLLAKLDRHFTDSGHIAVSAVIQNEIGAISLRQTGRRALILLAAHAALWSALMALYPYSRAIQTHVVWNRWVRLFGGLGYVSILLSSVPFLRKRLFVPFRSLLLADAQLDTFDPGTYFTKSRVKLAATGTSKTLLKAIPRLDGQIVLEGESGLGKTSFLKYQLSRSRRIVAYLPATKCAEGVMAAIQIKLKALANDHGFLKRLIDAGAIDIIVDGLNEVSPQTHNLIVSFAEEHFEGNLLITTQPMEWQSPKGARTFVLEPLSREQIKDFLLTRADTLPADAAIKGPDYHAACQAYVDRSLKSAGTEETRAVLRAMSNPMDLTVIADMIARGQEPNILDLREQQYDLMAADYSRLNNGHGFPLNAFSERTFELRLADRNHFDAHEFQPELLRMFEYRMVVSRPDGATGKTVYEFRHDKIMDYFLYQSFVISQKNRQAEYLHDSRFRGVYLLLATNLPYQDALALREALINRAVETRDHSLSDEFIQAIRARSLATVLFTDLVESTATQARIGDKAWSDLMNRHDELCQTQVAQGGGTLIKFTGDGVLATFRSPTAALACANAIRDGLATLDLRARFGVHTGEIEFRGSDVSGIGVTIAARIMDTASGGQILVSDLTRQLTLGSAYSFRDCGEHRLKGVPDLWRLHEASGG